jgi:hypothetical protein
MDATLTILLLGVALLAIVALPSLLRRKNDADSLAPNALETAPAPRAAKMATPEDIQSQGFARWLCEQASAQTGVDLRHDPMALTRISEAAQKAQAEIDASGHADIYLPYITADSSGTKHFTLKVTRDQWASARHRIP